jgi:hypothetical protein
VTTASLFGQRAAGALHARYEKRCGQQSHSRRAVRRSPQSSTVGPATLQTIRRRPAKQVERECLRSAIAIGFSEARKAGTKVLPFSRMTAIEDTGNKNGRAGVFLLDRTNHHSCRETSR